MLFFQVLRFTDMKKKTRRFLVLTHQERFAVASSVKGRTSQKSMAHRSKVLTFTYKNDTVSLGVKVLTHQECFTVASSVNGRASKKSMAHRVVSPCFSWKFSTAYRRCAVKKARSAMLFFQVLWFTDIKNATFLILTHQECFAVATSSVNGRTSKKSMAHRS